MNRANITRMINDFEAAIAESRGIRFPHIPVPVGFNMSSFGMTKEWQGIFLGAEEAYKWAIHSSMVSEIFPPEADKLDTCGTVCCIAGLAALYQGKRLGHATSIDLADFFDIDKEEAHAIAMGLNGDGAFRPVRMETIRPTEVVTMLKHLLATGEVKWTWEPRE